MPTRWIILFVLFFARSTMAFQFEATAALAPFIADSYGASLAEIGLLIGLYLAPGIFIAIPGSAGALRFGDARIVTAGMLLMLVGGVVMGFGAGWGALLVGRVLTGAGGVVINVVMTKMLADWFAGREISTAMGIFINSWPVGIALALLTLPEFAAIGGLRLAWIAVLGFIVIGLALFVILYRPADTVPAPAPVAKGVRTGRLPYYPLFLAGSIWALYNSAFAVVFSFGPTLLVGQGRSLAAAGSLTSLFILCLALSVPLGGYIADRFGRRDTVLVVGFIGFGVLMAAVPLVPPRAIGAVFVAMGLLAGLPPGLIMSMPAQVLAPGQRAMGMGIFYTIYYGAMIVVPAGGGWLADITGNIGATFTLGAAMIAACLVVLWLFRRVAITAPVSA